MSMFRNSQRHFDTLKSIAARLKNDSSRNTSELSCSAALPALERQEPELAKAAIEVLDAGAKTLENSGQPEPLGSLLLMLAHRHNISRLSFPSTSCTWSPVASARTAPVDFSIILTRIARRSLGEPPCLGRTECVRR